MKKARSNIHVEMTLPKPFQTSPTAVKKFHTKTLEKDYFEKPPLERMYPRNSEISAKNEYIQAKNMNLRTRSNSANVKGSSIFSKSSLINTKRSTSTSTNINNNLRQKRPSTVPPPLTDTEKDFTSFDDETSKISWSKILQHRTAYIQGHILDTCDPLRSLHFLIEEFCSKIKMRVNVSTGNLVGNSDLERMLRNIREIMVRIPQNSQNINPADAKGLCMSCLKKRTKHISRGIQTNDANKAKTVSKIVQTVFNNVTSSTQVNLFEKQFESQLKNIEENHAILEKENSQLREENQRLQTAIAKEIAQVNNLRAEIEMNDKVYQDDKSKFLEEIFALTTEVESKKHLDTKTTEIGNLNKKVNELSIHNKILETELDTANKETVQAQLKYEKMCAIIENREKQLVKMHQEFMNIQEAVNSNIVEDERLFSSSSPSNKNDQINSESWGMLSNILTHENSVVSNVDKTSKSTSYSKSTNVSKSGDGKNVDLNESMNKMSFVRLPSDTSSIYSQATNMSEIIDYTNINKISSNLLQRQPGVSLKVQKCMDDFHELNSSADELMTTKRHRGSIFK